MKISNCRNCQSKEIIEVLNLGNLYFSGVFPKNVNEQVPKGELRVVLCNECGLGQLDRNFSQSLLYGDNYGYRSGLNKSMISHLQKIINKLRPLVGSVDRPLILDIASNDGTLLMEAKRLGFRTIGIDPLINKFSNYYDEETIQINSFFNKDAYFSRMSEPSDLVTSIAVFYDLEKPNDFIRDVYEVLKPGGIWFLELSYAPWMLKTGSYDTICHEHLEYYSFTTIKNMIEKCDFKILSVKMTETNGGSMAITVQKSPHQISFQKSVINVIEEEQKNRINTPETWHKFFKKIRLHREKTWEFFAEAKKKKLRIAGLGASTKGNIYLQFNELSSEEIEVIGEVNSEKYDRLTPGSLIPIRAELDVLLSDYDHYLVLPWHFRSTFENLGKKHKKHEKFIYPF